MSTASLNQITEFPTDVIVRAFGGKPVRLQATARMGGTIEVRGADKSKAIGFPAGDVFRFDRQRFNRLRVAYESGEADRLEREWQSAKPLE